VVNSYLAMTDKFTVSLTNQTYIAVFDIEIIITESE
jgi:hypothetical protein